MKRKAEKQEVSEDEGDNPKPSNAREKKGKPPERKKSTRNPEKRAMPRNERQYSVITSKLLSVLTCPIQDSDVCRDKKCSHLSKFIQLVQHLVLVFSRLRHEATILANGAMLLACESHAKTVFPMTQQGSTKLSKSEQKIRQPTKIPIPDPDQKFYYSCLNTVIKNDASSSKFEAIRSFFERHWTPTEMQYSKECKGFSSMIPVLAREMETNAQTSLSYPFFQKQKNVLRLLFPKGPLYPKGTCWEVIKKINGEDTDAEAAAVSCDDDDDVDDDVPVPMNTQDDCDVDDQGGEGEDQPKKAKKPKIILDVKSLELIKQHRAILTPTGEEVTFKYLKDHPQEVLLYYHFLMKIIDGERNRKQSLSEEEMNGMMKIKSKSILPLHKYGMISLPIQTNGLHSIYGKLRWLRPKDSATLFGNRDVEEWRKLLGGQTLRGSPGWMLDTRFTTNGYKASVAYIKHNPSLKVEKEAKFRTKKQKLADAAATPLKPLLQNTSGLFRDVEITAGRGLRYHVVGVDPGRTDLVTVHGPHSKDAHFSKNQWYRECGFDWSRVKREKIIANEKEKNEDLKKAIMATYEESFKVADVLRFAANWKARAGHEQALWNFYSKEVFQKMAFTVRVKKQKTMYKVCKLILSVADPLLFPPEVRMMSPPARCDIPPKAVRLTSAAKSSSSSSSSSSSCSSSSWASATRTWGSPGINTPSPCSASGSSSILPHQPCRPKIIIAYGNGKFPTSAKGQRAGPLSAIPKRLVHLCKLPRVNAAVVMTDEFRTSATCDSCLRAGRCGDLQKLEQPKIWAMLPVRGLDAITGKRKVETFIDPHTKRRRKKYEPVFGRRHTILRCNHTECFNGWRHRDFVAARNIRFIVEEILRGRPRPSALQRGKKTTTKPKTEKKNK